MRTLTGMQASMATKEKLDSFKTEVRSVVKQEVQTEVAAAVAPLEARLTKLELKTDTTLDTAPYEVTFRSFPNNAALEEKLRAMEQYLSNFPSFSAQVGNRYNGPRSKRVCTNLGYARFVDTDARDNFLKACKNRPFTFQGSTLKVEAALDRLARKRGWALPEAERLLKEAAPDKTVVLTKKPKRQVLVDDVVAFDQPPNSAGSFLGAYSHLSLPG